MDNRVEVFYCFELPVAGVILFCFGELIYMDIDLRAVLVCFPFVMPLFSLLHRLLLMGLFCDLHLMQAGSFGPF